MENLTNRQLIPIAVSQKWPEKVLHSFTRDFPWPQSTFLPFECGVSGPFPKLLIFKNGKMTIYGQTHNFSRVKRVKVIFQDVLGSIPHVAHNFKCLTQKKVKTKWQLHEKIACGREGLCHVTLG